MAYTVDENMSLKNILDGAAIELEETGIDHVQSHGAKFALPFRWCACRSALPTIPG